MTQPITGAQCAAARALTGVSVATLAQRSGVNAALIETFEAGADLPDARQAQAIRAALESFGAVFIAEDRKGGDMGAGVRLRFTAATARHVNAWENEGGAAGDDDVPA
ncbi:XRE family transcriptional regulator [Camelimonas abortus]|uniref:XRE family transcriptional regulator n=1 Tax=Camelimonas abortus TaxID=1017184 RepID=A0ABV7LGF6_9HYPH